MKYYFLLLALACNSITIAQELKKPKHVYGMLPYSDDGLSWLDQAEVSMIDWYGFLSDLSGNGDQALALELLPSKVFNEISEVVDIMRYNLDETIYDDESAIVTRVGGYKILVSAEHYDRYSDYLDRYFSTPVTGISYDAVVKYYIPHMEEYVNSSKQVQKSDYHVELSLPSEEEFMRVAEDNRFYADPENPSDYPDSVNIKGCALYDYKTTVVCEGTEGKQEYYGYTDGPVEVYSYNPSKQGFYGLQGNAMEMLQEKGYAKGGSYNMYAYQAHFSFLYEYTEPTAELGFRLHGRLIKD